MTKENAWDVVAYGYASQPDRQGMMWNSVGRDRGDISENFACSYVVRTTSWPSWDHLAFRLRNGQIIRVRAK